MSEQAKAELPPLDVTAEDERNAAELIYWSGAQGNTWEPSVKDAYSQMYCRERQLSDALAEAQRLREQLAQMEGGKK